LAAAGTLSPTDSLPAAGMLYKTYILLAANGLHTYCVVDVYDNEVVIFVLFSKDVIRALKKDISRN